MIFLMAKSCFRYWSMNPCTRCNSENNFLHDVFMLLKCFIVPIIVSTCYTCVTKLPWTLWPPCPLYQCHCLWCKVNWIKEILWVRNTLTSFTAWSCKHLYQHKWARQWHWEKQENQKLPLRKTSMWLKFKRLTIDLDCLTNLERHNCDT